MRRMGLLALAELLVVIVMEAEFGVGLPSEWL